jgi:hypothetical protein
VVIFLLTIAAMIIHEGGHYLAALFFGRRLEFRFEWETVPRFVWDMPEMEAWKQRVVALAGFGLEFAAILAFGRYYAVAALAHLAVYKLYAGEFDDFRWI